MESKPQVKTFFKYPGGKSKFSETLMNYLPECDTFTDVFVGGGSVTLRYASKFRDSNIIINDADVFTFSIWKILVDGDDSDIRRFGDMVHRHPTVELFKENRSKLQSSNDIVERAYLGLFFHKTTFSGMFNGNPIGGFGQKSKWTIDCHYNSENILSKFMAARELLKDRTTILNLDFRKLHPKGLSYFDPPYVGVGDKLYDVTFSNTDHNELCKYLRELKTRWVLSYNDDPLVRELYGSSEFDIKEYSVKSTMTSFNKTGDGRCLKKSELIISRKYQD
jgi:DNA adenine methylase